MTRKLLQRIFGEVRARLPAFPSSARHEPAFQSARRPSPPGVFGPSKLSREEFAVKKCPLIPLGDRIVIVPEPPLRQTKGGLFLLKDAPGSTSYGEAVAVGLEAENAPPEGSRVLYERLRGLRVVIGEQEWALVREAEVLAVVPA